MEPGLEPDCLLRGCAKPPPLRMMLIGFWKTLILAVLFAVGYFLGTVENKSEFMKNAANKLIPDKEAKVIDFKTELAREQEQAQNTAEEAVKAEENKE